MDLSDLSLPPAPGVRPPEPWPTAADDLPALFRDANGNEILIDPDDLAADLAEWRKEARYE